jgi:hypothetical protein
MATAVTTEFGSDWERVEGGRLNPSTSATLPCADTGATPDFERQDSPAAQALETRRPKGIFVIVNESHKAFACSCSVAVIKAASRGKLCPLCHGGSAANTEASAQTNRSGSAA